MALATQCPHCHTTFRVANDQLKLRAGLVRCGVCKEIFNGAEHLLAADPAPQATDTPEVAISDEPAKEPDSSVEEASRSATLSASLDFVVDVEEPAIEPSETDEPAEPTETLEPDEALEQPEQPEPSELPSVTLDKADDPLQRMTLMEFSAVDYAADRAEPSLVAAADINDPLDQVIEDLQRKPLRGRKKKSTTPKVVPDTQVEPDEPEVEEPGFVTRGRRRQKVGRTLRISMAIGSFVLLLGLLAQGAYSLRNQIAARLPQAKPILAEACAMIGCKIGLPAQIETLAIESSELQAVAGNKDMFVLTALLRNDSGTIQAWPNIELTLNDTNDKALVRRIFTPRDYLASAQDVAKGFVPSSEQAVKLFFELSQLKASGYHVGLFYP